MSALREMRDELKFLRGAVPDVAREAAQKIRARYEDDARSKRGNIPPIRVEATGAGVAITAPAWSLEKAAELGQIDEWTELVRNTARERL